MQITLDIPEHYLTDATPAEFGKSIRLYAALAMFRAGKLSAGAAAEFAEIDRFSFAEECRKHRIPLIDYPPEDLRAELQ
jgi:predicted HTH domain antitoxin